VFSTPAGLDKARAASSFSAALSHLKFFVQAESFENVFPIKFFENLFSATPVASFWQLVWQFLLGFAAFVKSGLNFQKKGHFGQTFFHFHRERKSTYGSERKSIRAAAAWCLARLCALPPSFFLPVRSCLRGAVSVNKLILCAKHLRHTAHGTAQGGGGEGGCGVAGRSKTKQKDGGAFALTN
jgi:hypothetical protein